MEKTIKKLVLINAPIDKRYQDSTSIFYPPLGLLAIKSYVELHNESIEIELYDGMILTQTEIVRRMCRFKPDLVGVSIQLLSYKNALKICRVAKEIGAITFMGGHHATQLYNNILLNKHKWVDCIVRGDGEVAISSLCRGENIYNIPNVAFYDRYVDKVKANAMIHYELDQLVNPYRTTNIDMTKYDENLRKSNFGYKGGRYLRIYSHKGCRFRKYGKRCVFCGRADEGYRFFSVEKYFSMISTLGLQKEDFLFDVGDDLLGNDQWLEAAVRFKEGNNIYVCPIGIFGRGDEITDIRAKKLFALGVRDVTVGVESGDNTVLSSVKKGILGADVFYGAARALFENGIGMTPSYVLGLPGETRKSVYNTIKHAERIKDLSIDILGEAPNEMVANLLEPIPGSYAYKVLVDAFPERYLLQDELELEQMQRDYICTIHNMDISEYKDYRNFLVESGKRINQMVGFADPQGWLLGEMKGEK